MITPQQKAVAILLTLLHLGTKDIRLGPSLPAFTTSNVLGVLVEKFGLKPITPPVKTLRRFSEKMWIAAKLKKQHNIFTDSLQILIHNEKKGQDEPAPCP